jgi:hypothetical protein
VPANEPQPPSGKRRNLLRIFILGVLCLHAAFFLSLAGRIERGYPDFIVFYTAANIIRRGLGHELYAGHVQNEVQKQITGQLPERIGPLPYIHPPFEALIFLPLSYFPFRLAFALWNLLNLGMLLVIFMLLRSSVAALRLIPPWECGLIALAFFPVFECLLQGQDSILQLFFCVLAWKSLKQKRDVAAGCWFALGAFKFQLMLPIVLLTIVWKHRRVLVGFALISSVLAAISLGIVGWRGLLRYPSFAVEIANTPTLGGVPTDFLPNLHGLIAGWPLRLTGPSGAAVTVLISAGLFIFVAFKKTGTGPPKADLQFALAITVSELIGWQTNIHDFTLLVLAMVLIADYCLHLSLHPQERRFALLDPMFPLLISPIWLILWLTVGKVNLLAIPLLWWIWKLGQELSRSRLVREAQRAAETRHLI